VVKYSAFSIELFPARCRLKPRGAERSLATGVEMSDKKVQCVPGGHQISIDKAYWCNRCEYYLCYEHARTSVMVNTLKCPKGHEITRAK
jgi:hypothetical protein